MNRSSPLNILLAEDERSVAFSISFALKCDGHEIKIASDGEQAFAQIIAEPAAFDLLITDHNMPRMTGIELVRRLRDTPFRGKILVLSAHLSSENRAAYDALRVDGMMAKPFDVHRLRGLIRLIMEDRIPPISEPQNATPLSRINVYDLLKLGLSDPDEAEDSA